MTKRAQILLCITLLLLWAGVIAVRVLTEPAPQRVPLKFVSGQTLAREALREDSPAPAVKEPRLAATAQVVFKTPKNIFAPLDTRTDEAREAEARARLLAARKRTEQAVAAAPSPSPPPPSPEELAAREAQRQAELARQQKEQAIQQARKTMGQYRFLGYLTQNGSPQAFLGKGNDIFIVRAGETIEGKIQVKSIDAAAVKLLEQITSTETSLPLTKEGS
ncbi:MAG: hypothetical protein ACREI9_06755 [Nitrospiraceae bacterium]